MIIKIINHLQNHFKRVELYVHVMRPLFIISHLVLMTHQSLFGILVKAIKIWVEDFSAEKKTNP